MTATANLLSGLFKIDARNKKLFLAGNIVPNSWYHKLLTKTGSPDLTTIAVLSEIIYWYRPKVVKDKMTGEKQAISKFLGNVWQTSYSHFKTKFNLSHETVRRSLVRLEELGIIVREFRTVCVKGQAYNNRLFVKLNEDCKSSFFMPSEEDPCPQIGGEHIENNKTKNLNNRSTEQSKFFKNSDLEQLKEVVDETMATKEVSLADSNFSERQAREQIEDDANLDGQSHRKKFIPLINKKPLSHFYPLSEEDCKALRFESGREFSRNFINQLWGRVRSRVIEYYNRSGKEGECIDRHWFSKLDPEVNEEHRQISLKAPTSFIRDWVQTNYLRVIEEFCQQESYELTGLVVG